ncbi:metallophosphoesterase family protein [Candidatus Ferrigenium straubiae]|jgi:3',5'-cyclic AMP phosphodiesterase CpdA|uniref:metallophosphoesterase family protein n=1 Tax=Candidatus Ferrigenium straubiae TaxID=2919506 RepID=UPI003F4AF778
MTNLKIAIISDLHIGHGVRSKDLSPHADTNGIDEKYLLKFLEFVKSKNIQANYLVIPGDITGKAHPDEFKLASKVILQIGTALGVPEEKILFVPGNHDKNWDAKPAGENDTTGFYAKQMYAPLQHEDWFFEHTMRRSPHHMLSDNCLGVWTFEDLILVGYNSSNHDDRNTKVHHGLITESSLQWLDAQLQTMDLAKQKLKVFLVHHHPIQYSDHIPDTPDFSVMTNAENLLNLLTKFKFDLLLHGHKHMPHFKTQITNSSFPLVILGAGSFSYQLELTYNQHASNQFHLLEIEGRDDEEECIFGLLRNWAYLSGHGWKASQKHDGILHQLGFGTYASPTILKKNLVQKIQTLFQKTDYVRWLDLVTQESKLGYIHPDCVMLLLKEISAEIGVECHGEIPDNAILLLPRKAN